MASSNDSSSNHMWIPSSFFCPLSTCLMTNPVTADDGQSYQRTVIERWFADGNMSSPFNGRPLDTHRLIPNRALSAAIEEWEEQVITEIPRGALRLKAASSNQCDCQHYFSSNLTFSGAPCEVPVRVVKMSSSRIQLPALDLVRIGRHPHLARLRGLCTKGGENLLATERAPYGTLLDAIARLHRQNPNAVSWRHRISMLQQICATLYFLEQSCNAHDCISIDNVHLFDFSETNPEQTLVKLSGYGFKPCRHEVSVYESWSHQATPSKESPDEKTRVLMFGVLALQILSTQEEIDNKTRKDRFKGKTRREIVYPTVLRSTRPLGCPQSLWVNIRRCLTQDHSLRPTFSQLLSSLMAPDVDDQSSLGNSQVLEITIKSLTGKLYFIEVRSDSTIFEVKGVIQVELGIETAQQRLVYDGKVLEDTRTLSFYDCHSGSVLFLILRLRCIASPQPASFGKYVCFPCDNVLVSDDARKRASKTKARLILESNGGSVKAFPFMSEDNTVLLVSSCKALVKYLDGCAGVVNKDQDLRLTLSRVKLAEIVGELSALMLEDHFGAPYDIIRVRRTVASDNWVPFHIDDSRRTMQVALNSDEDFDGGNLIFATETGFVESPRPAGSTTIHTRFAVHGVTKLRQGIRYGLFLCDLYGHYERKVIGYLNEAAMKQLEFFKIAVNFLGSLDDRNISGYIQDYVVYMTQSNRTELPSLGVGIVWRTHLLSPIQYREFCETATVECISTGLIDHVPGEAYGYRMSNPIMASTESTNNVRVDLTSAVKRQIEFMRQVLSSSHIRNGQGLKDSVEDYYIFMRQVREKKTKEEPSLSVDFIWHTHMQFPRRYEEECHLIVGRFVDHQVPV